MPMPPPMSPPPFKTRKSTRPKHLREYPRWIAGLVRSFFSHLFYIVRLVHETKPWLLWLMTLFCLLGGILPVIGAWISRDLLNGVAAMIEEGRLSGDFADFLCNELLGRFRTVTFLILFQFLHHLLTRVINRFSTLTNNLAGELVANHIKRKIM
ncbi:MAG: hypothetical protein J6T24_04175, partial [Clostridia bacterium]|nr:hypothetical protein [Clostridia bacterium]